jgi:glutamyl-tRNA synthetase
MIYKTRFAPSPTGMLHIGGVRTALFDYLAAKSSGGEFCLRIEDTDRERFVEGAIEAIHEGLAWLGLKHDGEVISQSDRVPTYQTHAYSLLKTGAAYKCFCTPERLAELKEKQIADKLPPVYDRHCLSLSEDEVAAFEKAKRKYVVRFRIPPNPTEISWNDKVRGKIAIPTKPLEDFILIKSDGWPTYNFANVIDDHDMDINLVIRGDEFVPSTPKHILVYKALGWKHPEFAHVPVIVGEDMKKLSKRNGDTALSEYKANGYLPEALLNFLVFLGWNPGTTDEIFSLAELEKAFGINRIGRAPAVFDVERLNYINGVYIRNLEVAELTDRLLAFNSDLSKIKRSILERVVAVEQTRIKTLAEFTDIAAPYWTLPSYSPELLVFKKSTPEATKTGLEQSLATISAVSEADFAKMNVEDFNSLLTKITTDNKLGNADVFWPVRVALSGCDKSASPAELLWALGKNESVARLQSSL